MPRRPVDDPRFDADGIGPYEALLGDPVQGPDAAQRHYLASLVDELANEFVAALAPIFETR
jgi:hypothetical protein